jgi:acetamidase/formamidase
MHDHSIHRVRPDAYHQAWDRDLEPALEVEPGVEVGFEVRDASDEQLDPASTAADVAALDFGRVNPVCGPVFVKGARPGDALEVEILEFDRASGAGPRSSRASACWPTSSTSRGCAFLGSTWSGGRSSSPTV